MKKLLLLASLMLAFPASAHDPHNHFRAFLVGYHEVPSVSTQARGTFEASVNRDGVSFDFELTFDGLQAPVQQAHIHFAETRVNGPIVIWLCGTTAIPGPTGTQTCPQSGTVRGLITASNVLAAPTTQQLAAGEIAEMLDAMRAGAAYVNVHSAVSPGGEIRGQIFPSRR
jgi:hypothetical protein